MAESIEPQAKLIAALSDTMTNTLWADDILHRCTQIEAAIAEIRRIATSRKGGER